MGRLCMALLFQLLAAEVVAEPIGAARVDTVLPIQLPKGCEGTSFSGIELCCSIFVSATQGMAVRGICCPGVDSLWGTGKCMDLEQEE